MLDGEKIGTAEISNSGMLVMAINSDIVTKKLQFGMIEHLSLTSKIKE